MRTVQERVHAWVLRLGKIPAVIAITLISVALSVAMTWLANAVFMPHVPWEEWLYISIICPLLISPVVSTVVLSLLYQLVEARAELVKLAEIDPLTQVGNRRYFMSRGSEVMEKAKAKREAVTLLLLDIDHFKSINDEYGHSIGDEALAIVARVCWNALRTDDVFCRWGGEEFIALLPNTKLEMGVVLAERLRILMSQTSLASMDRPLSVSIGVAEMMPACAELDDLIARADELLYVAKAEGRNRVEPNALVELSALSEASLLH